MHAILAALGLGGFFLVLLATHRYGTGTIGDTDHYMATARNLLAGKGYVSYDGAPYMQWPPLWPTLLAALGLARVDPLTAARWLNALAFGLIVFLSGRLFLRCTASRTLALLGALSVLASKPLMDWSVTAMSEPVFIALGLLLALCFPRYLREHSPASLVLVSIVASLACLQRYAGVALVLAGVLLIALGPRGVPLRRRIKHVAIFGAISVMPVALWILRNRMLAGRTAGGHSFHLTNGAEIVAGFGTAVRIASLWVFPWRPGRSPWPVGLAWVVAAAVAIIVLSHVIRARRRRTTAEPARDTHPDAAACGWSAAAIGGAYFTFMVVCGAALDWHPEWRHMTFLYPFFMVFLAAALAAAGQLLCLGWKREWLIGALGVVLCALWLQCPVRVLYRDTARRMTDGAGGYATAAWQTSPLVQWLRDHPLQGRIYTNGPDTLYLLTRIVGVCTPRWRDAGSLADFARDPTPQPRYVVWFESLNRTWFHHLREITSSCRMEAVVTFPDGGVWRCLGPGGPGVSAVYRFWSPRTNGHLYTIDKFERDRLRIMGTGGWIDEDVLFYAFAQSQPGTSPVYRLWSQRLNALFYTMNEAEKDKFVNDSSGAWTCQGAAFYAYAEKTQPGLVPVYRLLAHKSGSHLYAVGEREREKILKNNSGAWADEGVAWYALAR